MLAYVQIGVHQDHQVIFVRAAFQLSDSQHRLVPGIGHPQMQDIVFLVELYEIHVSPFLQPVEVPLDCSIPLSSLSATTPSFISCADEDVEQV